MAQWTIRQATPMDEAALNGLYNQLLEALFGPDDGEDVLDFDGVWEDDEVVIYVAEAEGRVVGTLHSEVHRLSEDDAYLFLAHFCVDRAYRNRGIGSSLLREAEARAAALGLNRLQLDATYPHARAMSLYRRMGYVFLRPEEGDSWMVKHLTAEQ